MSDNSAVMKLLMELDVTMEINLPEIHKKWSTGIKSIMSYIEFIEQEQKEVQEEYNDTQEKYDNMVTLMQNTLRDLSNMSQERLDSVGKSHGINMNDYNKGSIDTVTRFLNRLNEPITKEE